MECLLMTSDKRLQYSHSHTPLALCSHKIPFKPLIFHQSHPVRVYRISLMPLASGAIRKGGHGEQHDGERKGECALGTAADAIPAQQAFNTVNIVCFDSACGVGLSLKHLLPWRYIPVSNCCDSPANGTAMQRLT